LPANRKIVLIEDEYKIAMMVKDYLQKEGFTVFTAGSGAAGLDLVGEHSPALLILDLMLPDMSGLEVCRILRQGQAQGQGRDLPIIMLTARSQEVDRVVGLEMGADDYITKPFSVAELAARVRAVLRRAACETGPPPAGLQEGTIVRGDLEVDLEKHTVRKKGRHITLTPTEFQILALMARQPGRVFSRLQLLETALGEAYSGYERSIDTHISNLRRKIEDDHSHPQFILTVFGLGYKFKDKEQ